MTAPKMLPMAFLFGKGHLQPFVDFTADAAHRPINCHAVAFGKNVVFVKTVFIYTIHAVRNLRATNCSRIFKILKLRFFYKNIIFII